MSHCYTSCEEPWASCLTLTLWQCFLPPLFSLPSPAYPVSNPYYHLFPAKPVSFSLCLPAEIWSCFLAAPSPGIHCTTALLSPADILPIPLLPALSFPFLLQMALSHHLPHCHCLSVGDGAPFLPTPKQMFACSRDALGSLRMPGEWSGSCFGNVSFSIWPRNYIGLSEQDGKASWIVSTWWKLGKEQSAVFLFCCLICFGFLYLCYSIWKEAAVHCSSLQHTVIFVCLKDCAVLCCLCAPTLESNYLNLRSPGTIL